MAALTWWRCEPCGIDIANDSDCHRCGAAPPGPFAVGATLRFTGVRIPRED